MPVNYGLGRSGMAYLQRIQMFHHLLGGTWEPCFHRYYYYYYYIIIIINSSSNGGGGSSSRVNSY
jgi:hypothetical protein